MEKEYVINKAVYRKLHALIVEVGYMDDFSVVIDSQSESVRFVNEDIGSSITIFSKPNTMRYLGYTVDAIMSEIIAKFGYRSNLHTYVDDLLKELKYI